MRRQIRDAIFMLTIGLITAGRSFATTYYIAATGADTNNGTAKTTPWLHAPGMPNCASICASTVPAAGDSFIFRGGDTWHTANGSATPYTGFGAGPSTASSSWNWSWSGTSSACNWPAATSSCIYIGVDQTWFTGSSWTRPSFDLDNPLSTSLVASCAFDQSSTFNGLSIGSFTGYPKYVANYVIVDNFNFFGHCHSQVTFLPSYIASSGIFITILHCYFHGWTMTNNPQPNGGSAEDGSPMISNSYTDAVVPGGATHDVAAYNVFDGSDSFCTGNLACTGRASDITYDFEHNVVRYMSNVLNGPSNVALVHDNLFEYIYESFDPAAHGGILEQNGNDLNQPMSIYNNIFRHTDIGITINLDTTLNSPLFFFNNVMYDIGNPSNCIALASASTATGQSATFVNNTIDANSTGCAFRLTKGGAPDQFQGTITFQNMHLIGTGQTTIAGWLGTLQTNQTLADKGNEIFQTEAIANGQGYVPGNNYQPTSTSNATYHAGANLSSSCSTYSADSALCSGTTGGVTNTAGSGTIPTLYISSPALRGSTWDAGAYQFNGQTVSKPAAPSGLVAKVQ